MSEDIICNAPCFPSKGGLRCPSNPTNREDIRFGVDLGRVFYASLLDTERARCHKTSPKVGLIGLSPGTTQIDIFWRALHNGKSYGDAVIAASYSGRGKQISAMLDGLGIINYFGLRITDRENIAANEGIWVSSVVACGTLDEAGSPRSSSIGPSSAAGRCAQQRFVADMAKHRERGLQAVILFGKDGENEVGNVVRSTGLTVISLPHFGGSNGDEVELCSYPRGSFPACSEYINASHYDKYLEVWRRKKASGRVVGDNPISREKRDLRRAEKWRKINRLREQLRRQGIPA